MDKNNQLRRERAAQYNEALSSIDGVITPHCAKDSEHVYHIYAVRVAERDKVLKLMGEAGIGCGIHYPIPVHLQKAYSHLPYKVGSFPISERCANEFLSLPMFPELTAEQVDTVVDNLRELISAIL